MTGHIHHWTYHQPATCGATPVWSCDGEHGCGRYETKNPDPATGPTIVLEPSEKPPSSKAYE